jgi:hypothetical protein
MEFDSVRAQRDAARVDADKHARERDAAREELTLLSHEYQKAISLIIPYRLRTKIPKSLRDVLRPLKQAIRPR